MSRPQSLARQQKSPNQVDIQRVLVANRGEIAVRIIFACQSLGLESVLVVSEADRLTRGARLADRTVCIGASASSLSYLNIPALITAALETQCQALHPGYGFLAESQALAQACSDHGIVFVGPTPDQIHRMGNKLQARILAQESGVPMLSGSEKLRDASHAQALASAIGYPVMLKAAAGGGGRGMKIVSHEHELVSLFTSASAESRNAFGDDTLYLEKYIPNARHVEVQVLGDQHGHLIHLGERDCSLQRRHQKVVEESPAPNLVASAREGMRRSAIELARVLNYQSAGTDEFILDGDTQKYYFLEMNTRVQVEHPVSEAITGIDIVELQLKIAAGEVLPFKQEDIVFRGHAIECRINAELPLEGFRPSPGRITIWKPPQGPNIRLDTHCFEGYEVPIYYDSMLAKLIVYGANRAEAIRRMKNALKRFEVEGIGTTLPFLSFAMNHERFESGQVNTVLVEQLIKEMLDQTRSD